MKLTDALARFGLYPQVEKVVGSLPVEIQPTVRKAIELGQCIMMKRESVSTAGRIHYNGSPLIELNRKFFESGHDRSHDRNQTMLHEMAHLIAFYGYKTTGHGPKWQRISLQLGDDGRRTSSHQYIADIRKENPKHIYTCRDCGHQFNKMKALKSAENRFHGACKYKPNGGKLTHQQMR